MRILLLMISTQLIWACSFIAPGYIDTRPDLTTLEEGETTYGEVKSQLGMPATSQYVLGHQIKGTWYYNSTGASTSLLQMTKGDYEQGCDGCGKLTLEFRWKEDRNSSVLYTISSSSPVMSNNYKKAIQKINAGNFDDATKTMRKLSSLHNTRAQHILGLMYLNGDGAGENQQKAFYLFQAAARKGDARSLYDLGAMYRNGEYVSRDTKRAGNLYRRAAAKGHARAAWELGRILEQLGNKETAKNYYQQAHERGYNPKANKIIDDDPDGS